VFSTVEAIVHKARKLSVDATDEQKQQHATRIRHGMLALAGLIAFNAFYCFAGQPTLQRLPAWVVTGWGLIVVFSSTAIFMRRVVRREDAYVQEKFAQKILKKWEWGDAPPSDELKDIYLLHTAGPKQRGWGLRAYKGPVRELVADGLVTRGGLAILDSLRAQLGVSDKDHQKIIGELSAEERQLFDPAYQGSVEQRLAKQQYRKDLERIVVEAARQGAAPAPATLATLRAERGVDEKEEAAQLEQILAPGGPIAAIYTAELAEITRLVIAAEGTEDGRTAGIVDVRGASVSASLALLRHLALRRARDHIGNAIGVLAVMTKQRDLEEIREHARGKLDDDDLTALESVDPSLRKPLVEMIKRSQDETRTELDAGPLLQIAGDASGHLRAVVAMLLSRFDDDASRAALLAMLDDVEPIVRKAAVRAMRAKSRLTHDLLAKVFNDPSPIVHHNAVLPISWTP